MTSICFEFLPSARTIIVQSEILITTHIFLVAIVKILSTLLVLHLHGYQMFEVVERHSSK